MVDEFLVKRKRRKTQEFSKSSTSSTHVANPFKISTTDATDGELPFVAELIKYTFFISLFYIVVVSSKFDTHKNILIIIFFFLC